MLIVFAVFGTTYEIKNNLFAVMQSMDTYSLLGFVFRWLFASFSPAMEHAFEDEGAPFEEDAFLGEETNENTEESGDDYIEGDGLLEGLSPEEEGDELDIPFESEE